MSNESGSPSSEYTLITGDVRKADTVALITNGADAFPEDSFTGMYWTGGAAGGDGVYVLEPTYTPGVLATLAAQNNMLGKCIEAMEVNIDGTGHVIKLVTGEDDDETEKTRLENFFKEPFPGKSMVEIRRSLRRDIETTGNGYLEVIRNLADEIVMINWLDVQDMRLLRLGDVVEVQKVLDRDGQEMTVTIRTRERRYVQLVNGKSIYFKEFGAGRDIHRGTGEWVKDGARLPINLRGSEVIHFVGVKEPKTPYGSPRWISQLPSVLGSRKAEEHNLEFFDGGGIPPVLVIVQGGTLGREVKEDLKQHLSGIGGRHRAAVVEAISTSGSLESAGTVQVRVERFGCTDDKTEVLTKKGWQFIQDWDGSQVGTVVGGYLVYQNPLQYHVYDYEGDMIHIEGGATEFMVTPNHRVWYQQPRDKAMRFEFAYSSVARSNLIVPVAPVNGAASEFNFYFEIVGRNFPQDVWLDFLGMFISDGSTNGHESNPNTITITVKKSRKKEFIESFMKEIAEASGAKYTEHDYDDEYTRYALYHCELRRWLRVEVGASAKQKRIPSQFLELNQVQSERLLQSLMLGDGHYNGENGKHGWTFTTSSVGLADDVQLLALRAGYRSVLTPVKGRESEYCISITPRTFAHVTKGRCPAWGVVPYIGKVYCFTMQSGVFVTRRNGKVCITGNSERQQDAMFQNYDKACGENIRTSFRLPEMFIGMSGDMNFAIAYTAYMVAEAQVFFPERDEFDTVINTRIVKGLGAKKYVFSSLPVTLVDVQNQLKAIEYVREDKTVDGEEIIEVLNNITGLSFNYTEPPPPPEEMMGAGPTSPTSAGGKSPKQPLKLVKQPINAQTTGTGASPPYKVGKQELEELGIDLEGMEDISGIEELCTCADHLMG